MTAFVLHSFTTATLSHASRNIFYVIPNCIATIIMNEILWFCFASKKKSFTTKFLFNFVQVQKLVEMGFPEAQVRSILEAVGGDENLALERLL
jgi:hypothetical protein